MFKSDLVLSLAVVGALASSCTKEMATQNRLMTENHVAGTPPARTLPYRASSAAKETSETLTADEILLRDGRERFLISCSPCHDSEGTGQGTIVQRGFPQPPRLDSAPVNAIDDDTIFGIIGNGFGRMHGFGERVSADERRAIIAYIRFLQLRRAHPESLLQEGVGH